MFYGNNKNLERSLVCKVGGYRALERFIFSAEDHFEHSKAEAQNDLLGQQQKK
jgi:hypothetical protein